MKPLIIFSFILFILCGCDKDSLPTVAPNIATGVASNVDNTTATVSLSITDVSNSKEIGVLYSTNSAMLTSTDAQKGVIGNYKSDDNSATLTGLSAGTTYYYKAYAYNGGDYIYGDIKTFTTRGVQDIDGNVYNTVTIGTQTWMAENLKTTKYRDGQSIPNITDATSWINLATGALSDYDNDAVNGAYYGKLYNWYAVNDTRNIAPVGWHVATYAEWTTLENYLIANGYNYDGTTTGNKIAKSLAARTDWFTYAGADADVGVIANDLIKNNKSGFSSLPGGIRHKSDGTFEDLNTVGYWWTATLYNSVNAWMMAMGNGDSGLAENWYSRNTGLSVRCVKDY